MKNQLYVFETDLPAYIPQAKASGLCGKSDKCKSINFDLPVEASSLYERSLGRDTY